MNKIKFEDKYITPSKVICVGRNYVEHIKELNNEIPDEIVLFIKPNSAICSKIYKPKDLCRFEAEICFIVESGEIVGAGIGFDLTLVNQQEKAKRKGLPWEKAKAFDKSAVFSEFKKINSWESLRLELYINDELRQIADINLMINKPDVLLQEIKKYFSLENGDIIMTGTPKGVGFFEKGDRFFARLFNQNMLLIEKLWIVE